MAALIDTHKLYTEFTESGFEPRQAETLIRAVQSSQDQLATKQDLEMAVTKLEAKISDVRNELKGELDAGLARVETKIAESKNSLWLAVFMLVAAQVAAQIVSHFWK
jgi:hypothetical protein